MTSDYICAVTWFGQLHRFLGLDWSYLMILGFVGNLLFAMRFIVQWIASEKRGESVLPVSFWHFSIAGSMILGAYFIFRRDPVGIVSSLPNSVIYLRNLHLIGRKARLANELESAEVWRHS
ncbi:MAG TPA: lipid-A-disaccharide synthase N-terminal domain-containing protein, partial [Chthoniobacterales bacterium]|nr:lipid-A-disaccharide synthase N-terminal domain-containing protein [Chthoniobacterales bacterium]